MDAVIGLPANLFYGTSIPACVLIFKKNRKCRDVLFIDASGDGNFEKGKNQNILRDLDIKKITSTYKDYKTVDKYSYVATFDEIKENNFNLNIPRYVDTFEEEEMVGIGSNAIRPVVDIEFSRYACYLVVMNGDSTKDIIALGQYVNVFRGASPRPKGDSRYYGGNIPRVLIEDLTSDENPKKLKKWLIII